MKKILAFVAMVAFCNQVAIAQSENMSEAEMAAAINADHSKVFVQTFQNPNIIIATGDSVVAGQNVAAGDTIYKVGYKYFYNGGLKKAPAYIIGRLKKEVTVRDESQWEALKHASVETRFAEEMAASSGRKRDTRWYEVTDGTDTIQVVKHGNDKNYWYVAGGGKYQVSDGCNGFGGFLQVQYWSDSFWFGAVSADVTRNEMYAKAEDAGAWYTSYSGSAFGGLKHDFGRRENITLALYGGFRATWQKTNTREFQDEYGNTYMMKSTHSTYSPLVGAMAKYRIPDTRFAIFGGAEWSQKNLTNQNASDYERHSAWDFFLGISIGLHGNYVRTK